MLLNSAPPFQFENQTIKVQNRNKGGYVEPINFFAIYKTKQKLNERLVTCFPVNSHSFTFKLIEEITASTDLVPT